MLYLKLYIAKLKNSSVYKTLLNNIFILAFHLLLLALTINNLIALIIYFGFSYYIFKNNKILFYASLVISVLFITKYIIFENLYKQMSFDEVSGKVVNIEKSDKYNKIELKKTHYQIIVYDYNFIELKIGDIVNVRGENLKAEGNRIEFGFNYQDYLKHEKAVSIIKSSNIEIIGYKFNLGIIKSYFDDYLGNHFRGDSLVFMKALVVGDDDGFSDEFSNAVTTNGILHLFAVSGLHIILFVDLITKILSFFDIKKNLIEIIIIIFLFLYLFLTNFSPSVIRATLMYYFTFASKKFKLGFSTLDVLSFVFIILLLYNPYYMYHLGFSLSFLAAVIIILVSSIIKKYHVISQTLIISTLALIVTFPIVININNDINLLSPLTNVLFIELVEGIILPISLVIVIFPLFKSLYSVIITGFIKITIFVSNNFLYKIYFPDLSFFQTTIYFLLLYLIVRMYTYKKVKNILVLLLVSFLISISYSSSLSPTTTVNFLDLYNGEAIFIQTPFNECNALIDTGDGSNEEVTNFLKSRGVKKIDYLFLTHNHIDHNGETNKIIEEINVNNIVISAYDNSVYKNNKSRKVVQAKTNINCGKIQFQILHPNRLYENENDNSLVIYSKIGEYSFLFLGDVSRSIEEEIAKLNLDVDVIKIAHHGSNTSSSSLLISSLRPKYAIIQTGRIEKFGFPNLNTIKMLEAYRMKIYRTDKDYSITYQYQNKISKFITLN